MKEIKKCVNCKWFISDGEYSKCHAPENIDFNDDVSLELGITTQIKYKAEYAQYQRKSNWLGARIFSSCGREGRWWQKKD